MVIGNFTELALQNFTVAEAQSILLPVIQFIIGMVIYSIFIFKFYRFLAKREILELETQKYYAAYEGIVHKVFKGIFYVLENLILIPILIFFWFAVLAALLMVLSKAPPETILLTSAAIVATVRISAYYNENLSQDLAKMIPFALLGVFLVDITYFSINDTIATLKAMPHMLDFLLYYLLFVTLLEFILRIVHMVSKIFIRKQIQDIQS